MTEEMLSQEQPSQVPPSVPASQDSSGTPPESKIPFLRKYLFIILAIAILALTVALVVYFAMVKKPATQSTESTPTPPAVILILEEPKDQQATTSAQIAVRGKSNPNSQITAYSETQEEIFESDQNGNFSGILTLDEGPNEITFIAFNESGEEISEIRSVVYITEKEL